MMLEKYQLIVVSKLDWLILLVYDIEGSLNNKYSLYFCIYCFLEKMLRFNLNEHMDFMKYVDKDDIVSGKNGVYDSNTEIKVDIMVTLY